MRGDITVYREAASYEKDPGDTSRVGWLVELTCHHIVKLNPYEGGHLNPSLPLGMHCPYCAKVAEAALEAARVS